MALPTVLMGVRARRAGGSDELRLQLSMEPERGGFRLSLCGGAGGQHISEFNLKDIAYQVKNPKCHQLTVLGRPGDPMIFNFEDEREAQKWWTVVSSSIREVQKATAISNSKVHNHPLPQPMLPTVGNPFRTMPAELNTSLIASTGNPFRMEQSDGDLSTTFLGVSKKEDLSLRLCKAIEMGDQQSASLYAGALAKQQASLQIQLKQASFPKSEISMKVGVEDASSSVNITVLVHAYTTVSMLKQQVFQEYGFHPSVQRWIIGQCLCMDDRTIGSYGIRQNGDTAFLYLLSAKKANLSRQRYEEDQNLAMISPAPLVSNLDSNSTDEKWKSCTLPSRLSAKKGIDLFGTPATPGLKGGESCGQVDANDLTFLLNMDRLKMSNAPSGTHPHRPPAAATLPSPVQIGWPCPTCTYVNKPTRPGCEMCSHDRPRDYVIPGSYKPDELERLRMQQEKDGIQKYQQEIGRREGRSHTLYDQNANSLDDFIHLSSEFS